MNIWNIYLAPFETRRGAIKSRLKELNHALGTNYAEKHMDNWIAGRKSTPIRVLNQLRRYVLAERYPKDAKKLCKLLQL